MKHWIERIADELNEMDVEKHTYWKFMRRIYSKRYRQSIKRIGK